MAVNYQKLWNILSHRGMTRSELRENAGITTNAMAKLGKNESVQVETLAKICCALDCKMDDILDINYDHYSTISLPDIDFCDFATANEYISLGVSSIKDFIWPLTRKGIKDQLIYYCSACELSYYACQELLDVLDGHGIHIDFPETIEPDLDLIPATQTLLNGVSEEDKERVCQKLFNCVYLAINNTGLSGQPLLDWLVSASECNTKYLTELGYIEARIHGDTTNFYGSAISKKSIADIYPLNLLGDIFGVGSGYCFANRLNDCVAVVEEVLDTLTEKERFWIKLKYQYGITNQSMLNALNLPNYETLLWVINNNRILNKGIRKLRHPSRAKKLFDYRKVKPYDVDYSSLGVYYDFQTEIENEIISVLESGAALSDALVKFYTPDVVEKVVQVSNKWKGVPSVAVDTMDLSWKTCAALEHANIRTLDELWFIHGKHLSLDNIEESGLGSIAGIGAQQISELLEKMARYTLLPINAADALKVVCYAENIANGDAEKPTIACCCIPHNVLRYLLSFKYRKIDDVITAFVEGNLESQIRKQAPECCTEVIDVLNQLVSNQYPVIHVDTSGFWCGVLENNPHYTLEDIRIAYLLDRPIKGNQHDLQVHISSLFPTEPNAFLLTYRTRSRSIHWIHWPARLFRNKIKSYFISKEQDTEITKAYYAYDSSDDGTQWIAAESKEDGTIKYHFFHLKDDGLHPIRNIDAKVMETIFDAISFNAELFDKTPVIKDNISGMYVEAQKNFCKLYGTHTATEEDQKFFKEFVPQVIVSKSSNVKIAEDITIDELDLTVRSYNCLKRANVRTVADILKLSGTELMAIRNMGKKSLVEIISKVEALGVSITVEVQQLYSESSKDIEQIKNQNK